MKKNTGNKIKLLGVSLARKLGKHLIALILFLILLYTFPAWWCQRQAETFYAPSFQTCQQLADGAFDQIKNMKMGSFETGSQLFDGEWLFGSNTMVAMGHAQMALQFPEYRQKAIERMQICFDNLLSDEVQSFDSDEWRGHNAIDNLQDDRHDHAAYLGYLNLPLSLYNHIRTNLLKDSEKDKHQQLNEKITDALARRMEKRPSMLLETYPREFYPVDNSAGAASIAVYSSAFGKYQKLVKKWKSSFSQFIDNDSNLLVQAVDAHAKPLSEPRGSGSSLAAYFMLFFDKKTSQRLYQGCREELYDTFFGFGLMNEYQERFRHLPGDIDSGPLLLGYSISTTGFSLACAKAYKDQKVFDGIFATANLAGAPELSANKIHWKTGGPLGDAIMFAMLTAPDSFKVEGKK